MPSRYEKWFRQVAFRAFLERAGFVLRPLAWTWRKLLFRTTFIAVTGTAGKTTTKECLGTILKSKGLTFRSLRNQNAGQSLTMNVLRVRPWHRYAVIETATGAPGDLGPSARLVRPDIGIVLCVKTAHTMGFRDLEQYAAEKAELPRNIRPGGLALLNGDDPRVAAMAPGLNARVLTFGRSEGCDYRADEVESKWPGRLQFRLHTPAAVRQVRTRLVGEHWLHAALAALAAAEAAGMDLDAAIEELSRIEPFAGRLSPQQAPSGAVFLRDDYSSIADGLEPALQVLREAQVRRRILVISDVSDFEGNFRKRRRFVASLLPGAVDVIVWVGQHSDYGVRRSIEAGIQPENAHDFVALGQAAEFLRKETGEGDLILLKGRSTDHMSRLFFSQLDEIECWKPYCEKRIDCDTCWELGVDGEALQRASRI